MLSRPDLVVARVWEWGQKGPLGVWEASDPGVRQRCLVPQIQQGLWHGTGPQDHPDICS